MMYAPSPLLLDAAFNGVLAIGMAHCVVRASQLVAQRPDRPAPRMLMTANATFMALLTANMLVDGAFIAKAAFA